LNRESGGKPLNLGISNNSHSDWILDKPCFGVNLSINKFCSRRAAPDKN
jgi:hypothetical protein